MDGTTGAGEALDLDGDGMTLGYGIADGDGTTGAGEATVGAGIVGTDGTTGAGEAGTTGVGPVTAAGAGTIGAGLEITTTDNTLSIEGDVVIIMTEHLPERIQELQLPIEIEVGLT